MTDKPVKPTRADLETQLTLMEAEATLFDGLDAACIGFVFDNGTCIAVYDEEACIEEIQKNMELDRNEAIQYFDFNISSAYLGVGTPLFLTSVRIFA